jgi:tetratricopeptide (TPR) repeat protein
MLFILANFVVLASATCFFWWLSGYDSRLTDENPREDFIRRALRCGITLLLVEVAFWGLWQYCQDGDRVAGFLYIATTLPLALIWTGCLSHVAAHIFTWLIDPEDKREFDPKYATRELDAIGNLIRMGKKDEAIRLCQILIQSGDANIPALEMTLAHLGVPQPDAKIFKPLITASALRREGKFGEAEVLLSSLLLKNPRDLDAAMMLARLYAQDFHRLDKAAEVLSALEKQPHISKDHIEFARRSIREWNAPQRKKSEAVVLPESVDELLAQKFFGTAVEKLERKIKEQPQDFDLLMKLAEIHAIQLANFPRAEKIVQLLETDQNFSAAQIASARARLKEWRETPLQRK